MPQLAFENVSHNYRSSQGGVRALANFSLEIAEGEPVALIGPSGCGKSTALQLAAGLLRPSEGRVALNGHDVEKPSQDVALILQDFGLLPWKTATENAALGLQIRGASKAERTRAAAEALAKVGLAEFANAYPAELSGGMRQRLALARAIALESRVLLMDEPLSALDALLREQMQELLLNLQRQNNYAQVLVTHSIEEAVFLGRRIVVMKPSPGRVVTIIENPEMGSAEYRREALFFQRCREVRDALDAAIAGSTEGGNDA